MLGKEKDVLDEALSCDHSLAPKLTVNFSANSQIGGNALAATAEPITSVCRIFGAGELWYAFAAK
jgi:hypothetical protein